MRQSSAILSIFVFPFFVAKHCLKFDRSLKPKLSGSTNEPISASQSFFLNQTLFMKVSFELFQGKLTLWFEIHPVNPLFILSKHNQRKQLTIKYQPDFMYINALGWKAKNRSRPLLELRRMVEQWLCSGEKSQVLFHSSFYQSN